MSGELQSNDTSRNATEYEIPNAVIEKVAVVFHDHWWPANKMNSREFQRYKEGTEKALKAFLDAVNE